MKKFLQKISDDFALATNAITQKFAWIGTSGGGKSYAATEFAEVLWDAGGQFIVLDPVGIWYGLRLDKSGKKPSHINIPVFGGLHGDVPLEPASGALIADLIIDRDICAIIDVSQFEFDTDKARFATAFAARFFFRKKSAPSAVHIFLEECQEFVPQVPQRGEEKMLHEFTRMQKIGRNFGIGMSLITQRPQEVSKRVLNLSSTLFAFRTTGSHEREAIEKWMKDIHAEDDFLNNLPKLETGCPHVWSPEYLKISKVVRILPKRTFDASATPEIGAKSIVRHLAPIDLEKIKTEMAATIEKAKAEDPKELQKIIKGLKDELSKKTSVSGQNQQKIVQNDPKVVEKAVIAAVTVERARSQKLVKQYIVFINKMLHLTGDRARAILDGVEQLTNQMPKEEDIHVAPAYIAPAKAAQPHQSQVAPVIHGHRPDVVIVDEMSDGKPMGVGEKAVLIACAQHGGCTRPQLTVLTGYKHSSRDAFIQRLKKRGYVEVGEKVTVTPDGEAALGGDYEPLPTGAALQEHLMRTLPEGQKKVLQILIDAHPNAVEREAITEMLGEGYQRSSRDAYIQRLSARKLVIKVGRGEVKASDDLF